MNIIKKYIFYFCLLFIVVFAFYFRLKAYMVARPLWLDECFAFKVICDYNFLDFFSLLENNQVIPPLLLGIFKIFFILFGQKELALRAFPFICSIISIPAFYYFSKIFLKSKLAILIASLLFSVNCYLIYYSQEFKQYSSDVLCFLILFIFLYKLSIDNLNKKKIISYALISSFSPLISIQAYFLLLAWGFRELIFNRKYIKTFVLINIPAFIFSLIYYFNTLKPQRDSIIPVKEFLDYWILGFINNDIAHNFEMLKNNILYCFEPCNRYLLIIGFIVLGLILLLKNYKQRETILFSFCLIVMFACSYLKLLPLQDRSILFSLSLLIVFIAKPFDYVSFNKKIYSIIIIILFMLAFCKYDFSYLKTCFNGNVIQIRFEHVFENNPRKLMEILKSEYNGEDTIVINEASSSEYYYYKKYYNFEPKKEIYTSYTRDKDLDFVAELNDLITENGKYWFFYSCDYFNDKPVVNSLKQWKDDYKVLKEYQILDSYLLYLEKY